MNNIKSINVMGTEYKVLEKGKEEDKILEQADGYCDLYNKAIVIDKKLLANTSTKNASALRDSVMRHELVHAMMYESGLDLQCSYARDEELIDWIAIQFPKMVKIFTKAGVME